MGFGKCEDTTDQRIIVLEENRRRVIMRNPRRARIRRVLVDGCAILEGKRCDYLIIGSNNTEYFVELKGCDIEHAVSQLETTIKKLGEQTKTIKRYSIVVSSRCPMLTPRIQKLKLYFTKNLMSTLIIKCNWLEIDI